jgi:formylglycine-generating enzyme required for sulfatase activity
MKDYYQILEVEPDASQEEIKSQYRFLVQGFHPDKYASAESKVKAEEKLKQINEAFAVLKDSAKRAQYDLERQYSKRNSEYQAQSEYERKKREREAKEKEEEEKRKKERAEAKRREQADREAKERAERERAKRAEEERFARAQAEKAQREAEEKLKSQPAPVKQSAEQDKKKLTGIHAAKKPLFALWEIVTLIFLGCFAIFLGGLGATIFSNNSPEVLMPTQTPFMMPFATMEIPTLSAPSPSATFQYIPTETQTVLSVTEIPATATQIYLIAEGAKMILIPAGSFPMGRIGSAQDEQPVHEVYLSDYYIDETEVTNAMYSECVNAGICTPPTKKSSPSHSFYFGNPEFDSYPVIYVSWNMANTFCQWRGVRLPTEAEWEKAARGTDGRIYPWGSIFNGNALNFCDINCPHQWAARNYNDGYADTAPVGSFLQGKSPSGALDMAGNIYEWVGDWYSNSYYAVSPKENPTGPKSGDGRILRGGAWGDGQGTSSTSRVYFSPSSAYEFSGFRCASSH